MPSPPDGPVPTRNKSPDKLGGIQGDLLSDHASDREPEDIHLLGAKSTDEGDDVAPHALH
jgi:hypothetical protein